MYGTIRPYEKTGYQDAQGWIFVPYLEEIEKANVQMTESDLARRII